MGTSETLYPIPTFCALQDLVCTWPAMVSSLQLLAAGGGSTDAVHLASCLLLLKEKGPLEFLTEVYLPLALSYPVFPPLFTFVLYSIITLWASCSFSRRAANALEIILLKVFFYSAACFLLLN